MPKHAETPQAKKVLKFKQSLYDGIFSSILELKEKVMEWWKYSLDAKLVCNACLEGSPRKRNEKGVCAFCDGTGYVPDKDQRNVAFREAIARLSPAPKSVEMRIDDNRDKEELMDLYKSKTKEEVDALLEKMNIPVRGEAELIASEDDDSKDS